MRTLSGSRRRSREQRSAGRCLPVPTGVEYHRRSRSRNLVPRSERRLPLRTPTKADPQPGLFIFGKSHYSATWVPQRQARPPFASPFEPTPEELAAACDALVVNSGAYEISGSELIVRPMVTRMPEFSGGRMIYRYGIKGNVLSLEVLDEYSCDGVQAPWILRQRLTLKLQRVE